MPKKICLIGLFRSGTNFTRTLLELNFDVLVSYDTWSWKHGLMPTYTADSKFKYSEEVPLFVVKDPYSTLDSLYVYAKNNGKNLRCNKESFESFLVNPIYFFNENNKLLSPEYYFSNPVQMWNSVVWNHLSFVEQKKGEVLRYEDILRSPESSIREVAESMQLKPVENEFFIPENVTQNMGDAKVRSEDRDYITNRKFSKERYFLSKGYLKKYDENSLRFMKDELNKTLLNKLNYSIEEKNTSHASSEYVIYTMCSDSRISSLATLLESNFALDNKLVKVIPFDDNMSLTRELCSIYGAEVIELEPVWDRLGKALYKEEEYRPGVMAWRYFRKFNVFNGSDENFIFLDSNVLLLSSLNDVVTGLRDNKILFGARSLKNRNFKPWAKTLINISDPRVGNGFNAGFWCTNSSLLDIVDFEDIIKTPGIRVCLTKSPEQSLLSMLVGLKKLKVSLISEVFPKYSAMLSAEGIDSRDLLLKNDLTYHKGQVALTVKWQGKYFGNNSAMPNRALLLDSVTKVLTKVKSSKELGRHLEEVFKKMTPE